LDLRKTIVVTVTTNNVAARSGGSDASMSADGNRVVFWSNSPDLGAGVGDFFLRDLTANTTEIMGKKGITGGLRSSDASISEDGNTIVFNCQGDVAAGKIWSWPTPNVFDARTHSYALAGDTNGVFFASVLSGDGRYVFYDATNQIIRFNVATGQKDSIVTNETQRPRPVAASYDGTTLAFLGAGGAIWKEGEGRRSLPPLGVTGIGPVTAMELSRDGNFLTLTAEAQVDSPTGRQLYFYDVAADSLRLISPDNDGLGIADGAPPDSAISSDGSVVVFSVFSEVLDVNGVRETANLFAWNRENGIADLLTTAPPNEFENTEPGDNNISEGNVISEDGRKVFYASTVEADADTNRTWDVFVMDRVSGARQLVSAALDGSSAGNAASYKAIISGDGTMVVFLSNASNLVSEAVEAGPGLFARDLRSGITRLVSVMPGLKKGGVRPWYSLSRDGRYVAFSTLASFDARDANSFWDIYIFDTSNGTRTLISFDRSGTSAGNGDSTWPAMSPDGKHVAFRSVATNLGFSVNTFPPPAFVRTLADGALRMVTPNVASNGSLGAQALQFDRASTRIIFAAGTPPLDALGGFKSFDLTTSVVGIVCTNCIEASVSEDGQWAAFTTREGARTRSVFLKDLVSASETRVTTNLFCHYPQVSSNGDFLVFQCWGPLLTNDVNGSTDIYTYDRRSGANSLISARNGAAANGPSLRPVLSADNRFVLFRSMASDLVANDFNDGADLFVAYLPGVDSDHDQIDDAWELAAFGSLEKGGEVDSDLDGLLDRDEFLAGTNPNDAGSAVRLTGLTRTDGGARIRWSAIPGRSYRLQTSSEVGASAVWRDVTQAVVAGGAEMELTLAAGATGGQVYFRVVAE
jgi:Tol biopolymer transport system component